MPLELENRTPSGKASEIVVGLASPGNASNEGSCCKENININKSETSKLNVEPLQLKRKKKGGGYNLRKSLAWDRAFFTEEGVLDPVELSMITGASCRELPVIHEGSPGDSQHTTEPLDLQKPENYKSKVPRNEDLTEERRRVCFSVRAQSSSSKLVASHKVSTHLGRKSVSRYGDSPQSVPIPVPSSSLKRPATVNDSKAAAKELKLPKVHGSVTGFSSIRATKSSMLRVNHLKHNQITQPGSNISLKSHKNQTATKRSSLQPTCHPEQNSGTSSVNRYSSANMSPQPGSNAYNFGSKNIAANLNSSNLLHSSERRNQPAIFSATFSQIAQSRGRIIDLSQNQNMKPSGLRMPSPSLSFFSQPKASVPDSLSSRDANIDACGSQKPGNLRLQDEMMRAPDIVNNMTESIKNNNTRYFMPSTTDVLNDALNNEKTFNTLAEDNKFVDGQTDDILDKKGNERIISLEDVDFLKVDYEIPPQTDNFELEIDGKNFQVANHICTVESQSRGSGWISLETSAEENNEIHKSEAEKAINEPCEERNTFDVSITNYNANFGTHLEDDTDYKGQNSKMTQVGCKDTCKPDCCKPFMALTNELRYPRSGIDKRGVETKERATELVGLSQLQSSSCNEGATSEDLEHRPAKVRSSDFGSDHQDEKPDCIFVTDDKLQDGEAHIQDAVFTLPIPDSKNKVNFVRKVGDDIKDSGNTLMIQDVCLRVELDSLRADEYHISDGFIYEKQTCFRKSQLEEIVETHPLVGLNRNDRNKLNETNVDSHHTPVENHVFNSDKVGMNKQILTDTEVDLVDNSSSLIHKTFNQDGYVCNTSYFELDVPSRETMQSEVSVNGSGDDGNYLRNDESEKVLLLDPANGNMSEVLYLVNGTMEIGHCSSFAKTNDHEVPQIMYKEVIKPMPLTKDDCQINWEASCSSPQEGEFDIDNQRNISDSRNILAQPPETNKLNECCIECWEHLELPNVTSEEEKKFRTDDGLHVKNRSQNQRIVSNESLEDDSLGSMFATVAESNVMHIDVITDHASIKPFSDANTVKIHQETINSICELHPNSDHDKVESALETNNNKNGIGCNEKGHQCIFPPSTIPFSDEWLAAIEAAGEEILTRKGGAVQNSPPDKLPPEPSPWSPVKKKTNQIGPFDCTKFSNNLH